ncbi:MAG: nucleoside monophosphate kinase, partial [Clostridia bacterium]|nr:nucleoside monophosphate kinase [Clostridia bacterium]
RQNINDKTPLGLKVKELIDKGMFCPDDLTVEIVKDRLKKPDCRNGYLLDGFPRNLFQAKALETFSPPDKVIDISVGLDKIERRITGRRVCSKCKESFHIDFIGETSVCPNCKGTLVIREDDNKEAAKERLKVYKEQTEPLIGYYAEQNKLFTVDGEKDVDSVFLEIEKVLDK